MLNFGTIGTSWITDAYVEGALDSGLWKLNAVYSRNYEKGKAFASKYGTETVFTDIEEMAKSDLIDAVYIASPNYLHVKQALVFIENGKHVICEKPVSSHVSDVITLVEAAKKHNVIFLEAIMFMHLPERDKLSEAVKKLGNISIAKFDFCQRSSKLDAYLRGELPNIFNPEMETGALMDLGIYCIYPALYLFGEPEEFDVRVNMMASGVDGSGVITFVYKDKLVSIPYSKTSQAGVDSDIQGDKGTVSTTSISKLENIVLKYSDGTKEIISGETPKYKLMGYEAIDFYKFITDKENSLEEYNKCTEMCIKVADITEKIRLKAGIKFPSDK